MGLVLDTYSKDLYRVHDIEWDKNLKAYSHIYRLDNDYHIEVVIRVSTYEVHLFDDSGHEVESTSSNSKGMSQLDILNALDSDIEVLLRERGIIE